MLFSPASRCHNVAQRTEVRDSPIEVERLEAFFTSNTAQAVRAARELDAVNQTLEKNLQKSTGLDKQTTQATKAAAATTKTSKQVADLTTSNKKLDDSLKTSTKDSESMSKGVAKIGNEADTASKKAKGLSGLLSSVFKGGGGSAAAGGGGGLFGSSILPGLSNISQIIQGIPQIGQLAGAITGPLISAMEDGVKLNIVLEQSEIAFTAVAGSADKAHDHLMKLQAFGAASPFRFEGLLKGARLMNAFGFSIDEQIPKLTIWGNAIAASGEISEEAVHSVVVAMGQMRLSGRLNAQDMNQLINANIPAWQLLAKSIGLSVAETRKLSEAGKLNGRVAMEAMTAMMAIDPRYQGMMDKLQKTVGGKLSALQDAIQIGGQQATIGTTTNLSKGLDDILGRQDLITTLSTKLNSILTPISGLVETGLKTVLTPGITTGITAGFAAGKDAVASSVVGFAQDAIMTPFKSLLGINSPSTVFIGYGQETAFGYSKGILSGLDSVTAEVMGGFDQMLDKVEGLMQSRTRHFVSVAQRSKTNLEKLMAREPDFLPKLIAGSRARGMNPDHLLNVMAVETSGTFNPGIKNPNSSASGLIQFMNSTAQQLGTTTAAIRAMTATQQLDLVFKYFDNYIKKYGTLDTQGKVYAAVGAGKVGENDDSVVMRKGNAGYEGNKATWDRNLDGVIRQGEMAQAAIVKLGAGVTFTVNGSPVASGNPMPVAFDTSQRMGKTSDQDWDAMVARARGKRGLGSVVNQPTMDDLFLPQRGPGEFSAANQATGTVPWGDPQLLTTTNTDISQLTLNLKKLTPLLDTTGNAAGRVAEEVAHAGDAAKQMGGEAGRLADALTNLKKAFSEKDAAAIAKWTKAVKDIMGEMGSMEQKLAQMMGSLPKMRDVMSDIFVSIPARFGDVVGQAVANADGTLRGFFSSLRQGFLKTLQDMLGDIARAGITKAVGTILTAAVGKPEMDPDTGEPTGKIKGGVGWIKSILGIFGIGSGGGGSAQSTTAQNTVAHQQNTLAVKQLTTAIQASAVTSAAGGGGGGGLWGTIAKWAIGAVVGGLGAGVSPGGMTDSPMPTIGPFGGGGASPTWAAFGGTARSGVPMVVGDHPSGKPNPELFLPASSGTIVPMGKLGGGDLHLHLTQVIHAPQGKVAPESAEQAANRAVAAMAHYNDKRAGAF